MKNKTKNRLKKKWQNLPLHHIDTCVVIEVLMKGDDYLSCENYLNKVGYKYRGTLSVSALGEIFMYLTKDIKEEIDRGEAFTIASRLIDKRKIDFSSPQFKTYVIVEKIKTIESRAEPMDSLNLATAIANDASVFVTMDATLLGNYKLESVFKIKIKHPGEL